MKFKILLLAMLSSFATAQTTLDNQMKSYTDKVNSIVSTEKANMKAETDKIDEAFSSGKITKAEQIAQKETVSKRYETIINDKIENERQQLEEITKSAVKNSVYSSDTIRNKNVMVFKNSVYPSTSERIKNNLQNISIQAL
jgi:cobalamin biosynthesis protein CbiD